MLSGKGETSMDEKEYSVSEAVRLIGVESHVLRYWEEELRVEIGRTPQGHRVYSESDVELFRRVRELKDRGLQLKAIRVLLDGTEGNLTKTSPEEQISKLGNLGENPAEQIREPKNLCESPAEQISEPENLCENPEEQNSEPENLCENLTRQSSEQENLCENTDEQGNQSVHVQDRVSVNDTATPECGHDGASVEVCQPCRTVFSEIEDQNPDHMEQFEAILKSLIREVIEEQNQKQNQKQEQLLREILREEIRQMYFSYEEMLQDVMREAAAERESVREPQGFPGRIRRFLQKHSIW